MAPGTAPGLAEEAVYSGDTPGNVDAEAASEWPEAASSGKKEMARNISAETSTETSVGRSLPGGLSKGLLVIRKQVGGVTISGLVRMDATDISFCSGDPWEAAAPSDAARLSRFCEGCASVRHATLFSAAGRIQPGQD